MRKKINNLLHVIFFTATCHNPTYIESVLLPIVTGVTNATMNEERKNAKTTGNQSFQLYKMYISFRLLF